MPKSAEMIFSKLTEQQKPEDFPKGEELKLLALMCREKPNAMEIARVLPPERWNEYKSIVAPVHEFVLKYKNAPKEHLKGLLEPLVSDEGNKKLANNLLEAFKKPIESPDYLMDVAYDRAKSFLVLDFGAKITKALMGGDTKEVLKLHDELQRSILQAKPLELGFELADDEWFHSEEANAEVMFPIFIDHLDNNNYGIKREQLAVLLAPVNQGKTFFLMWVCVCAAMAGFNSTFFTSEDGYDAIKQRFKMMLYKITNGGRVYQHLEFDEHGNATPVSPLVEFTTKDTDKVIEVATGDGRRGKIHVVRLTEGESTPSDVDTTLELLENLEEYPTDVCAVDYADRLGSEDGDNVPDYRVAANNFVRLRNIALKRNLAMVTADQTNKKPLGKKGSDVGLESTGRSFMKTHSADLILTLKRSDRDDNTAVMSIAKARGEVVGEKIILSQNYAIGQFVTSSCLAKKVKGDFNISEDPVNDDIRHEDDAALQADMDFEGF